MDQVCGRGAAADGGTPSLSHRKAQWCSGREDPSWGPTSARVRPMPVTHSDWSPTCARGVCQCCTLAARAGCLDRPGCTCDLAVSSRGHFSKRAGGDASCFCGVGARNPYDGWQLQAGTKQPLRPVLARRCRWSVGAWIGLSEMIPAGLISAPVPVPRNKLWSTASACEGRRLCSRCASALEGSGTAASGVAVQARVNSDGYAHMYCMDLLLAMDHCPKASTSLFVSIVLPNQNHVAKEKVKRLYAGAS